MLIALAALVALSGCSLSPLREETLPPDVTAVPIPPSVEGAAGSTEVTLFFRYQDEELLTTQTITLNGAYGDKRKLAEAALRELIAGPGEESRYDKRPVLPPSLKVTGVQGTESLCTVTLSRDLLTHTIDGAAISASTDPVLLAEADRARWLGVQAIVSTVVHTGAYSGVQILIEDAASGQGARVSRNALGFGAYQDELLGPLACDMSVVLTPNETLLIALESVRDRNAERLYKFVAQRDAAGNPRPLLQDVASRLEQSATLHGSPYVFGDEITVTGSGQRAIALVSASFLLRDGSSLDQDRYPVTLLREDEVWKIDFSSLEGLIPGF